jgi:hypothetical protein
MDLIDVSNQIHDAQRSLEDRLDRIIELLEDQADEPARIEIEIIGNTHRAPARWRRGPFSLRTSR